MGCLGSGLRLRYGCADLIHSVIHHVADRHLNVLIALNDGGIDLIDERLPGKKLVHIDPGGVDAVDEREGRQQVRSVQLRRCDGGFQDDPSGICLSGGDLLLCDCGKRSRDVAAAVHVDAVVVTVAGLDAQISDGRPDHLRILHRQVANEHLPGIPILQVHGVGHQMPDGRGVKGGRSAGNDGKCRQRCREGVGLNVRGCQACNLRRPGFNRPGIQAVDCRRRNVREFNRRRLDVRRADGGILNVRVPNGRLLDLKLTYRPILQLSDAHRAQGQLAPGDNTRGQLSRGDHAGTHRISNASQRHLLVLPGQAVVGVSRHAHGHFHTDALGNHAHGVPQEDALQKAVLSVFLRLGDVDELHGQGDGGQVTALVELRLRRFTHLRIALGLRLLLIPLGDLLTV